MSLEMHMKIDGVSGEITGLNHKGWSEIHSWNWGMTSNRKVSDDAEKSKTSLNELSVIKKLGTDSTAIRLLFAQSKTIPNVEFSVIPAVGKREAKSKYVHIVMENVVIKSVVTGGASDESSFKEHITFLFEKIKFECSKGPSMNSSEPTLDTHFNWDVPENAEWSTS